MERGCPVGFDKLGAREKIILQTYNTLRLAGEMLGTQTILERYDITKRDFDLLVSLIDEQARIDQDDASATTSQP